MNDAVRALKIAELIAGCHTDYRGDLLTAVADELRVRGQHYTARCVEAAAKAYDTGNGAPGG